jgi:hypothetical protein
MLRRQRMAGAQEGKQLHSLITRSRDQFKSVQTFTLSLQVNR